MGQFQHPNIVQIYECGEEGGLPYLALEYLEGGNLRDKLNGTPQPARSAAEFMETLARAIHQVHEKGIIHRDLKPSNILLTTIGSPKIADFGLAKLPETGPEQTQSGTILGTPSYMAPEQAARPGQGRRSRRGCLRRGAILYELLTGRPPFIGENLVDTLQQVRWEEPVPPKRLVPKIPRDLETICLKCLRKKPDHRYPSAEALADDLRRFLNGLPIQARPVSLLTRGVKWARRRPARAALILFARCGRPRRCILLLVAPTRHASSKSGGLGGDSQQGAHGCRASGHLRSQGLSE